jgi:hypothetical protein
MRCVALSLLPIPVGPNRCSTVAVLSSSGEQEIFGLFDSSRLARALAGDATKR